MVYARKPLIYAGLLNTMVTQSYLNNLIETCPQITRNQVVLTGSWVRIPPLPPIETLICNRMIKILVTVSVFSF